MKYLFFFLAFISIVSIKQTQAKHKEYVTDKDTILILSPLGVDPQKDTIGFNKLIFALTEPFATELTKLLNKKNIHSIKVFDQGAKYSIGQKLAIYSAKHKTKTVILLSLIQEPKESDQKLTYFFQVQYITLEFIYKNGKINGCNTKKVLVQKYEISNSSDSNKYYVENAKKFVKYLEKEHYL